jgi:hypothetical protein
VTDFPRLLAALTHGKVEFIIIGGFAATAHGSAYLTVDLDIVYRRTPDNVARLARACRRSIRTSAAHHQGCRSTSASRRYSAA